MKRIIIIVLLLMYNIGFGHAIKKRDSLYAVRVTFFPPLMSEKYLPGHIEAEILDIKRLIKTEILNKDDYYYINYWPSGNKKPAVNPTQKYKGVVSTVVYLNKEELIYFINSANEDSQKVTKTKNTFGDWRIGYNLFLNNCADAVLRAFKLKPDNGISIPAYVYNKIIKIKK